MVKHSRGFTVVEVSIVMTITFMLLTLTTAFLLRGKAYAAETETYASTQRTANTLIRKMSDDIYRTTLDQVQVDNGSVAFLSFGPTSSSEPPVTLDPLTGRICWKKWVGFSLNTDDHTIYRGELELAGYSINPQVTPPVPMVDAAGFATDPAVSRQPLPGRVRDFTVAKIDDRIQLSVTTWGESPIVTDDPSRREVVVTVRTELTLLD